MSLQNVFFSINVLLLFCDGEVVLLNTIKKHICRNKEPLLRKFTLCIYLHCNIHTVLKYWLFVSGLIVNDNSLIIKITGF